MKSRMIAGLVACTVVVGGCDEVREFLDPSGPPPPAAEEVEPFYATSGGLDSVYVSGNVVIVHVEQPYQQLQRGGSLWARVGPYIYLMTPATRSVFETFPGVVAVRVVTHLPDGTEVARAMLRRDAMSDVLWRRTLNILGTALEDGRESPRKLELLTEWGEDRTEFRYNPDYVN